ncbi:MAG: MotA/TolQ/ExbB proton channel family protein, partial [Proteobacteria bacterium]|nr:MotA/TolQ/ExbB proton channel family protein [Pseudomonadota bacterium]
MTRSMWITAALAGVGLVSVVFLGGLKSALFHLPSAAIVLGGTILGALIAYSRQDLLNLLRNLRRLFTVPRQDPRDLIELFVRLARAEKIGGPRSLEQEARKAGLFFLNLGVEMIDDGRGPHEIRATLERAMDTYLTRREGQRAVLNTMYRLAPALGLAGTMIGLIRMLSSLSDPSQVVSGLATALITTFYGLILANLVVLPLSRKMLEHIRHEALVLSLILEGVMALKAGEHPTIIRRRLQNGFFPDSAEGLRAAAEPV